MSTAIRIENIGKRYRLGETHARTLSDQIVDLARRVGGRAARETIAPEDFWALRDINLEIAEGEAVGIIGGNGAGKSTLLKILSRITQPTTGRVLVRGRMSSLLEVGTGFHPELSGRDNVFLNGTILGMRKAEVARKFDEIVAFSGVERFIDTPVKRYSSGMYVRLAFAVAAHLEPDVLVIDEVLAVGDAEFQKRCLGKMGEVAREGRTVIFVSHDLAAIQKLCPRAVWLKAGQVQAQGVSEAVINEYVAEAKSSSSDAQSPSGHLLLRSADPSMGRDCEIISARLLSRDGEPMQRVRTWDPVTFRIGFEARKAFRSISVELCISTPQDVVVLLTSTSPDRTVPLSLQPGSYEIDCEIERLPLAAGDYRISVRLAIPGLEYLYRIAVPSLLRVEPRDVFASGLPPTARRALLVTPHDWVGLRSVDPTDGSVGSRSING